MKFAGLYEFSDAGMKTMEQVVAGHCDENVLVPDDPHLTHLIPGTRTFEVADFPTARDMAAAILNSMGDNQFATLLPRAGLWAWLSFVLREVLFPRDVHGRRKYGEVHRWLPSAPNDWQKGQRHLVRMPVLLLHTLGSNADHLLCTRPSVLPEIREQLTSQQDMFYPAFQAVARRLYYDDNTGALKRGAGGKSAGSPRRLARVRQQLDVTWDLWDMPAENLLEILPSEFDRFKPHPDQRTADDVSPVIHNSPAL